VFPADSLTDKSESRSFSNVLNIHFIKSFADMNKCLLNSCRKQNSQYSETHHVSFSTSGLIFCLLAYLYTCYQPGLLTRPTVCTESPKKQTFKMTLNKMRRAYRFILESVNRGTLFLFHVS
jgi:hypothetical protein